MMTGLMAWAVFVSGSGAWGCFFFFSSRRRHTRFDCDWSSDVCSSDLGPGGHRDRRGHAPSGRRGPDLGRRKDTGARARPRRERDGPIRDQGGRRVDRPRDAEDLAYKCSSMRGMYFSTASFALSGSFPTPIRMTRRAFRPPWMIRYWLALEWMITLSRTSLASDVTVSAEPIRTANIDPNVSTWTPFGKLPAR